MSISEILHVTREEKGDSCMTLMRFSCCLITCRPSYNDLLLARYLQLSLKQGENAFSPFMHTYLGMCVVFSVLHHPVYVHVHDVEHTTVQHTM